VKYIEMADALEFKTSQLSLTLLRVLDSDMQRLEAELCVKLEKLARFLQGAPVVVDPQCALNSIQLAQLLELLRQQQMTLVGVRTADASLVEYAQLCGLTVFKPAAAGQTATSSSTTPPDATSVSTPAPTAVVTVEPHLVMAKRLASLRSGQIEKHMLGDVLVSGTVNSGAELYAGGHVIILDAARGRVHAGATGDRQARIIARNFNPELVSIAGVFLLADDIPAQAKRAWVEVYLEGQMLKFSLLS
jgi:septum site-determining protein MinC